jgi:hypothetical protein
MCEAHNRTDDEKDITHDAKDQCPDNAPDQYCYLQCRRFGFLRNQSKADLTKFRKRADQSQRVVEQTGMPRRIAR